MRSVCVACDSAEIERCPPCVTSRGLLPWRLNLAVTPHLAPSPSLTLPSHWRSCCYNNASLRCAGLPPLRSIAFPFIIPARRPSAECIQTCTCGDLSRPVTAPSRRRDPERPRARGVLARRSPMVTVSLLAERHGRSAQP